MMARFGSALFAALILISPIAADDSADDLKNLQGTWQVTRGVISGRPASSENANDSRLTISGDTMTFESSRETGSAKIMLGTSDGVRTLDAEVLDGADKGKKRLAIYELTGDTLKLAWTRGEKRPEKLESSTNSDIIYLELRRQNP